MRASLLASGVCWQSWEFLDLQLHHPLSTAIFAWCFPSVCVSSVYLRPVSKLFSSYKDTSHPGFGMTLIQFDLILITSKDPLSKYVTFIGPGVKDLNISLLGNRSQSTTEAIGNFILSEVAIPAVVPSITTGQRRHLRCYEPQLARSRGTISAYDP